jgi:hypothetical protein
MRRQSVHCQEEFRSAGGVAHEAEVSLLCVVGKVLARALGAATSYFLILT